MTAHELLEGDLRGSDTATTERAMKYLTLLMLLMASAVFATEQEEKPKTTPANSANEVAVIKTSEGDMVVHRRW